MPLLVTACAPSADTGVPSTDSTADTSAWSNTTAVAATIVVVVVVTAGIRIPSLSPLILLARLYRLLRSMLGLVLVLDCLHQKPVTKSRQRAQHNMSRHDLQRIICYW